MLGGKRKKLRSARIDSLIGRHTETLGDLRFSGGLHVDGTVKGNVYADDDSGAVLTLSENLGSSTAAISSSTSSSSSSSSLLRLPGSSAIENSGDARLDAL